MNHVTVLTAGYVQAIEGRNSSPARRMMVPDAWPVLSPLSRAIMRL